MDFREIERELMQYFREEGWYINALRLTGDQEASFNEVDFNITECAKHLTDYINQRGTKS